MRLAQDAVAAYSHDAALNGLEFDRHEEELAVETFSRALRTAGLKLRSRPDGSPPDPQLEPRHVGTARLPPGATGGRRGGQPLSALDSRPGARPAASRYLPALGRREPMRIGDIPLGDASPLVLIAGLNVIETEAATLAAARVLRDLAERHGFPLVFKASVDKANRSHLGLVPRPRLRRGPAHPRAREGASSGLPAAHRRPRARPRRSRPRRVVDCLQIPAFLCRQTDLLVACAATGLPVNVKKGQFMAPARHAPRRREGRTPAGRAASSSPSAARASGTTTWWSTSAAWSRCASFAPVCFDATHSVQQPGAGGTASDGDRRMVAPLARAAVALGIDALFVEAHPDPDERALRRPEPDRLRGARRAARARCAPSTRALRGGA